MWCRVGRALLHVQAGTTKQKAINEDLRTTKDVCATVEERPFRAA
jgi:hypothetical protein